MIKQYIDVGQTQAYLRDLVHRVLRVIDSSAHDKPLLIVGVGGSGNQVATAFLDELLNELPESKNAYPICVDRVADSSKPRIRVISTGSLGNNAELQLPELPNGGDILLMDDIERSGETMRLAYEALRDQYSSYQTANGGVVRIWSYSIALSTNSSFVPTWYGFLYPPHVFVYRADEKNTVPNFDLDHLPSKTKKSSSGTAVVGRPFFLRKPKQGDPNFQIRMPASMARYHAADRYFDHETRSKTVLILENDGQPVGYLGYHIENSNLWISAIAVCDTVRSTLPGAGHALFSYVENAAITLTCRKILLWAFEPRLEKYQGWGFYKVDDVSVTVPGTVDDEPEKYFLMALRVDAQRRFNY